MPAKAKIKVVTEEITEAGDDKTEKVESLTAPKPKESVEEETSKETPDTTVDTSKLTSFSTLDVENPPAEQAPVSETPAEPESKTEVPEVADELPKEVNSDDIKAWLTDVRPDTSKEMEKGGKSGFKIFLIIVLLLVAIGLAAGGVYYYKNNTTANTEETAENTQLQATETPTPEPTAADIDLKKFSVNVLNGSGVTGEAKKVSEMLVADGFSEAKTGNAANSDFTKTEVALKDDTSEDVFNAVKKSLGETYDVVKAEKPLDAKSTYDVVITVGEKKS